MEQGLGLRCAVFLLDNTKVLHGAGPLLLVRSVLGEVEPVST